MDHSLRKRSTVAGLVVAALALAAACGTTETPAAPPAPPATAPPSTRDEKGDQQIARDALITKKDLPSGSDWEETKRSLSSEAEPSTSDNPLDTCPEAKALAQDLGLDKTGKAINAKSSKFSGGAGLTQTQIEESVEILANEDQATSMANVFGDDAMPKCVQDSLEKAFATDTSKAVTVDPAKIDVERVKVGKLGDDHAVFLITFPVQSSGITLNGSVVAGFVRVGRGYANVSYVTFSKVDVDKDVMPVLEGAAAKLKKALQN